MRVIKNIHNNISLCLDSKGNEVIAFGKGIGFKKPPYDFDIENIESTFYNVDPVYIDMISNIPEDIIEISKKIIDYAGNLLNGTVSNNIVFTLADHINFCLIRFKSNLYIKLPIMAEIRYLYPKEIQIGEYALELIKDKYNIQLPKDEAAVITLHIIEYGASNKNNDDTSNSRKIIDKCTDVIEQEMNVSIKKDSFNYTRFISHMYFLLERIQNNEPLKSTNKKIFKQLVKEYPTTFNCVKKVKEILRQNLSDEESIYLILHINRLISREGN